MKKRLIQTIIEIIILVVIAMPWVLAANDPGHDTLYVLKVGDTITGNLNISQNLNVTQNATIQGKKLDVGVLTFYGDGSTISSGSTMAATTTNITIDATNLYLKWNVGSNNVYIGQRGASAVALNVSGSLYVGGQNFSSVCLTNGTNCPPSLGGANLTANGATTGYIPQFQNSSVLNNSVIYQNNSNVGIGTTSPGAKLDVGGKLSVTGGYTATTGQNGIHFGFSSNVGQILSLEEGAAWRNLKIDAANLFLQSDSNGYVGIGTTAPGYKLDVNGTIKTDVTNVGSAGGLRLGGNAIRGSIAYDTYQTVWAAYNIYGNGTNYITAGDIGQGIIGESGKLHLIYAPASQSQAETTFIGNYAKVTFDLANGKVGIGTTAPVATLTVSGNLSVNGTTNSSIDSGTLFIDATNDRVGIGTSSPTRVLQIENSGSDLFSVKRTGYDAYGFMQSAGTGLHVYDFTDSRTDMFFDGASKVGIGTTAPGNTLTVNGTINATTIYQNNSMVGAAGNCPSGQYVQNVTVVGVNCSTPATGSGTVTSITAGTGLVANASPITTSGMINVSAATCQGANNVSVYNGTGFNCTPISGGTYTADNYTLSLTNTQFTFNSTWGNATYTNISKVGTVTNTNLCHGNGSAVQCEDPAVTMASSSISATNFSCTDCIGGAQLADTINLDAPLLINSNNVTIDSASSTFFVDATNDRVGIGTTNPVAPLDVKYTGGAFAHLGDYTNGWALEETSNAYFHISEADSGISTLTRRITIAHSTGNVGIGTASPGWQTVINGSGQATASFSDAGAKGAALLLSDTGYVANSGGALLFGGTGDNHFFAGIKGLLSDGTTNTIGDLIIATRNAVGDATLTERMRFQSTGNISVDSGTLFIDATNDKVGIGTQGPSTKLSVNFSDSGTTPSASNIIAISNTDTTNNNIAGIWFGQADGYSAGAGVLAIMTDHTVGARDADLALYTTQDNSLTEKMRILNNGNVGIGSVAPTAKLESNSSSGVEQLRLGYNSTSFGNITVDSSGNMTLKATSGNVIIRLG